MATRARAQEPPATPAPVTDAPATELPEASAADAALPASSEGDVVEIIDAGEPSPSLPTVVSERFELHGWAREVLELGLWRGGYRAAEPSPTALPYDKLISRSQLFARARYSRGTYFEADISGYFSYSLSEQGPARGASNFTGFNGQQAMGSYESGLHELFVAFFWGDLDFRVGQQRVAWGRADFFSPNDVVNARDNRTPFLAEPELRMVPTLLLRADWNFAFGSLQAIASPVFVPDRGDIAGTNWAGVQPDAPHVLRALVRSPEAASALAVVPPAADWTATQAGTRFAWTYGGWDVAHYYHYGFDGPLISLDPALAERLSATDLRRLRNDEVELLTAAAGSGAAPFVASFVPRHHVGLDVGTTLGPLAFRVDAAYQSSRVFYRQDLLGFSSPTLLGVASLELQTGEREKGVLVEWLYVRTLERSSVPLLSYARDTLGLAALARWKLVEPLSGELRVVWGIEPRTSVVQPSVSARFDDLTLSLGGLWLGGDVGSLGHYFRRNREVYCKAKYSF